MGKGMGMLPQSKNRAVAGTKLGFSPPPAPASGGYSIFKRRTDN